ncbi:citrate synthase [Planctomyces sp. SH-PL62]|uniref:citrate synthase n=1 Tax=Planctomyces sp. SH-PL62 TaxID=1636152 RepID=UPI00078E8E7C|nr:citrate synthase [Planctomyces sp. SH-PL62]AMV39779.1 Citrate synthase 1 [Planctomyces sp. SH-PL62]
MARTATLTFNDRSIQLPVVEGSEGELGLDISKLRSETGLITLDPGYGNTGACTSAITFIDGEKGVLRYRGIPIEELARESTFVEVAWLLIFGRLPQQAELDDFRERLVRNAALHEAFRHHFEGFLVDAPPMAILSAMVNTIACFPRRGTEDESPEERFLEDASQLISKVRTIAACSYRRAMGLPFVYPDSKLPYVANFLHMMFSAPYAEHVASPEVVDALNLILLLHADHEQNCSTSTVRIVGSSQANIYASCAAAVGALWGPLHGGANMAVLEMLEKIHKGGISAADAIKMAKDSSSGFRLMGFGHRVYKNFDPRAKILKQAADKVLGQLGVKDPLLDVARQLEEMALKDSYFVDRRLYPNVDFYSGIIMRAIGIPTNMFTVIFAIGRMPGWIAQWKEQADDPKARIARPRQIYTGPTEKRYVPIDQR